MTRVVGVDIGVANARIVSGQVRKGAVEIDQAAIVAPEDVGSALEGMGLSSAQVYVGVTGRDMILRTTQVPPVPDWQLRELMKYEIDDVAEQSGDELSADFNVLAGAAPWIEEDLVLLALVRTRLIEERTADLLASKVKVRAFTPNPVALHNAYTATREPDGTVMVACIGGGNTDIALIHEGDLLFARNLAGGGDLFTSALVDTFGIDRAKAETVKRKLGRVARPGEKLEGQQASVARALEGAVHKLTGMLQSSLMLCKNQLKATDLQLDRVLLCGAGAAIGGLDESLSRRLDLPVERFDPSEGYLVGEVDVLEERGADFAVATGLAMMGALKGSYKIEILPDEVRKRRRFLDKTLWLGLAAVAVVAQLAYQAFATRTQYDAARAEMATLRREVEMRLADTRGYERSVDEVAELAAKLTLIEQTTAPASGVLSVLDMLAAYLPSELWVTAVRSVDEVEPEFGHGNQRRPYVVVEGRGKEISRNLSEAVTELTTRLRAEPAVAAVLPRFTTDSRGDFTFDLRLDMSSFPQPDAAGEDEDDTGGPE